MSRFMRGTILLTAATFLTKLLGLLFIIPFTRIVGEQGVALYGYAYTPYTILLSIATLGVPLAVSKFVAKYNALGDYATGRRLLKSGLYVMSISGFLAFLLLFFSAEAIAHTLVKPDAVDGNSVQDVTLVIQLVSTALILVPAMSLVRGYFQGFESMGPTAISQVVEQVLRIGFILVGSYFVMEVFQGTIGQAVSFATFAATIGAIGSIGVLFWYWRKRKPLLDKQLNKPSQEHQITYKTMYKELITYAVPFVAVGLAIPLYLLIDQFTINRALISEWGLPQKDAEAQYAILTQLAQKLIMIPVSLATAFALTLIPAVTKSFTNKRFSEIQSQLNQSLQALLFLTVPAAIGISLLSFPAYSILFGNGSLEIGGAVLKWYAPTAVLFALFTVSAAILQGINQQRFAVYSLGGGILIKLALNYWLITKYGVYGAIIGTNLGYLFSVILNGYAIRKYTSFKFNFIIKRGLIISLFVGGMALGVQAIKLGIDLAIPGGYEQPLQSFLILIIGAFIGASLYLWLGIRFGIATQIFGERFRFFSKKSMKKGT